MPEMSCLTIRVKKKQQSEEQKAARKKTEAYRHRRRQAGSRGTRIATAKADCSFGTRPYPRRHGGRLPRRMGREEAESACACAGEGGLRTLTTRPCQDPIGDAMGVLWAKHSRPPTGVSDHRCASVGASLSCCGILARANSLAAASAALRPGRQHLCTKLGPRPMQPCRWLVVLLLVALLSCLCAASWSANFIVKVSRGPAWFCSLSCRKRLSLKNAMASRTSPLVSATSTTTCSPTMYAVRCCTVIHRLAGLVLRAPFWMCAWKSLQSHHGRSLLRGL
jgi:hypothetical protein